MNLVQVTKLMHRNWLHFYTLTMKDQKEKSRSNSIYHCIKKNKIPRNTKSLHRRSGLSSQSYGFSSSHVWMWEMDNKEGWVPKNWCFQIVVLEKSPESPLDCKEIKPVNPKQNQLWIFIARTDAEAEVPRLWLPDVKSQFVSKDPDAGKDWR